MVPQPKKIGRALKSAATSATLLKPIRSSVRRSPNIQPQPGESPAALLRVQVIAGKDLLSRDRNGFSDPFVVVSLSRQRSQTPTEKRTLNPTWEAKDATFDFPIYLSVVETFGVLELVIWDKDLLTKDYLGEVSLPLEDWFKDSNSSAFEDPKNEAFWAPVVSTKPSAPSTGNIQIKLGLVSSNADVPNTDFFDATYAELLKISHGVGTSLNSAAPTVSIGTIRSSHGGHILHYDGLSSDDEGAESDAEEPDSFSSSPHLRHISLDQSTSQTTLPPPSTDTSEKSKPYKPSPGNLIPKFNRRQTSTSTSNGDSSSSKSKKHKFRKSWTAKAADYNFSAGNDILGIVMLEIKGAEDLPKFKNMTRLGWDMDPFAVISFGKKVFRTRVIRHSLNPIWDEKLLFHVRRYEANFKINISILDWDKLSGNDYIGDLSLDLSELVDRAPKKDPVTALYPDLPGVDHDMTDFRLPLAAAKDAPFDSKYHPVVTFRAKYQPYDALRQKFWRVYLSQYDVDNTLSLSHIEISSMLDSLGSTLCKETVDSFFIRHGHAADEEVSIDEAVICLEQELSRPISEKKRIPKAGLSSLDISGVATPGLTPKDLSQPPALDKLDFTGPAIHEAATAIKSYSTVASLFNPQAHPTEPFQRPLLDVTLPDSSSLSTLVFGTSIPDSSPPAYTRQSSASSSDGEDSSGVSSDDIVERVINIKNCPLCHRPRLKAKAEADIVTHIALCASRDWGKVDKIVVGNFVTASQAQRKWYTKMITKVSSGAYQLGANSANIIVQNRMTGQLEEEKMQVYVRLGIRLLYKGAKSRMEGARARRLLKSMSIKQGMKYDLPESAHEIPAFIEFHNLNVDEIRDPLTSFKTFNQFFYRNLKESARPLADPDDATTLVSGADCRMMAFETVHEATQFWIKGREFTIARLLGDRYGDQAAKYTGGSLAIFRLAPQDYHRFHSPVDGTIGPMTYVAGEYYTVNPQAIRTSLDVYGENARKIVPIDSPVFGRVFAVCVGAMMVGSIRTTVEEGDFVTRGQEFGYFAFGGSTIVLLFEKHMVQWDEDLLINGRAALETLVRVGMRLGKARSSVKVDA